MKKLLLIIFLCIAYSGYGQTYYTVSAKKTKLLEYPNFNADVLIKIKKDDKVEYIESFNDVWMKVKYQDKVGYITEMQVIEKLNSSTPSTSVNHSSGGGHTYRTGPRGGQYYINSKGNKVYKKKN